MCLIPKKRVLLRPGVREKLKERAAVFSSDHQFLSGGSLGSSVCDLCAFIFLTL